MTVKLVGSTSGSVSLQAPASTTGGAHRVLTLPDINSTIDTTGRPGNILQVVNSFKGLKYRQEIISDKKDILIINDSKSTSIASSENLLKNLKNVYWILCGIPKKGDKFNLTKFQCKNFKGYIFGKHQIEFSKNLKNKLNIKKFKNLKDTLNQIFSEIKAGKLLLGSGKYDTIISPLIDLSFSKTDNACAITGTVGVSSFASSGGRFTTRQPYDSATEAISSLSVLVIKLSTILHWRSDSIVERINGFQPTKRICFFFTP